MPQRVRVLRPPYRISSLLLIAEVQQQEQSPLYSLLSKEMRDMIWKFALADDGAPSLDSNNIFRRERGAEADVAKVDSTCALLQT